MTGQQSLRNFYESVRFSYPVLAANISDDIISVAINALADDKSDGQPAVERLGAKTRELPEIHRRVLENALSELGYS